MAANNSDGSGLLWLIVIVAAAWWLWQGRDCTEYASDFSCSYIEDKAEYEVWYWRNLDSDNPADEKYIGNAVGIKMCEANARAYAQTIGEPWNYRAYICVLIKDGRRLEKHRNLG